MVSPMSLWSPTVFQMWVVLSRDVSFWFSSLIDVLWSKGYQLTKAEVAVWWKRYPKPFAEWDGVGVGGGKGIEVKARVSLQPSKHCNLRGRVIWLETWHISTEWKIRVPLPKLLAKGNWQREDWLPFLSSPPPTSSFLPLLAVCEEQSRWLPVADFSWQHAIRNCRPVDQSTQHDRFAARPGSLSASTVAFPSFFPALIGESFFTVLVAEEILLNVVTIKCWLL